MLVFDLESDGFLDVVSKIHCLVMRNTETGVTVRYNNQPQTWGLNVYADGMKRAPLEEGLKELESAKEICGHNVIKYDIPVIQKLYPWFKPKGKVVDTLTLSRLIYTDIKDRDFRAEKKYKGKWIAKNKYGSHALEAWGQRLGNFKGDFKGPWDVWTEEMEDYCVQDIDVTCDVLQHMNDKGCAQQAQDLEHAVTWIIARQERRGIAFSVNEAAKLYAILVGRKEELTTKLREIFKPFYLRNGKTFIPKRDNAKLGYAEGAPVTKLKLVDFNPGSRDHIAINLQRLYGWKPKAFGKDGKATVDEEVLSVLRYPPVELLLEFLMVDKRTGQLAEGKQAWLKCEKNGRIHGSVNSNGAVTGRMTHSHPNLGQVPAGYSPYGHECRSLFVPGVGYILVGCDADGLELRALAHFMARYDGGAYAKTVVEGNKEDGTDAHSVNMRAIGLSSRDTAKTWFYAFIYGAGPEKLGAIAAEDLPREERPRSSKARRELGLATRSRFESNLPALGKLVKAVRKAAKRGYLIGLDGRKLNVRSAHAALNTLLQSAGAVIMKQALVILDDKLQNDLGYTPGEDYEFVANVHDEFQIEAHREYTRPHLIGVAAAKSIEEAGEMYNFQCPLAGSFAIGESWNETH